MESQTIRTLFLSIIFINLIMKCALKPASESDDNINSAIENRIDSDSHDMVYREQYAKEMLSFMNQSVDPCDDFYEYACGNWKNVIEERFDDIKRNSLLDIAYKIVDMLAELLDKPAEDFNLKHQTAELKLAQKFYKSCLEADLYPLQKSEEYLNFINEIGGFPAVNSTWNADNFDWFNMSAHLNLYYVNALVNEHQFLEYPFPPLFELPELGFEYYVHSDNIATNTTRGYKLNAARMRRYLTLYGVEEPKVTEVISGVFDFWYAVLDVIDQFNEDWSKCKIMSLAMPDDELLQRWDNYMDIVWPGVDFNPEWNVTQTMCHYFYANLDKICNQHKEAVANYLAMKFLHTMDADLDGTSYQKEYCVNEIKSNFPFIINKIYLATHYNEKIEADVKSIVKELRNSFHYIIEHADFLDDETRAQALLKESLITVRVGHLKNSSMIDWFIREMNNVDFVENNYDRNNMNVKKFGAYMKRFNGLHRNELSKESKPIDLMNALLTNGFYYSIDNSINIMAGMLHPPVYHMAWPKSLKFSALGSLIGHEITHGFDCNGRLYDGNGIMKDWWSKTAREQFAKQSQCYIDHYNSYLIPEIQRHIDGNNTIDENIADNGGLRESFYAYRRYIENLTKGNSADAINTLKAEHMPGIDLKPEQMFFVGYAQLWCASYKQEHYWKELTDEHTMDKYRVLGTMSNSEEFAQAYKCPAGSKMNPKANKCRIW